MTPQTPQPDETVSLSTQRRIDEVCLAFEDAWQAGARPSLEDLIAESPPSDQAPLLRELLVLELHYRREQDETPEEREYQARFPMCLEIVAAAFAVSFSAKTARLERLARTALEHVGDSPAPRYTPGEQLGRYTIQRVLGSGGYGEVYLVDDGVLGRSAALKAPRLDRFRSEADVDRYLDEARTAAQLEHPGIVSVFDAGRLEDGTPFIAMRYIEGRSLRDLLCDAPFSHAQSAGLLAKVAEAVHYAHKQGFIHRDLKPANILIDTGGNPHVADFGLAIHESQQHLKAGDSSGTLAYMAPEQIRGETHRLDGRADVWALGVMLYEALTRRRPFQGDDPARVADEILSRQPKPPRQIDDRIPVELERMCLKCLAKQIPDRYATAADLASDLRSCLRAPRRRSVASVAGLLIAVLAIGLVVWLSSGPRNGRPAEKTMARKPEPQTPRQAGPLEGNVDVLIWDPDDPARRGLGLREPGALPLRAGDQIRVEAVLNGPLYVYLIWIDCEGKVFPVYPWHRGDWTERPDEEQPRARLALPEQLDRGWPMQGGPGMETLMLLARKTPLPPDEDLASLLADLEPQPMQNARSLVEFHAGTIITEAVSRDRGPVFFDPQRIDDPVLQTQQKLAERLSPHFELIRAVSFANRGG